MAKKDKDEMAAQEMPQTMEDYLLSQLEEQVVLKDGSTLKGQDGHVMTKQEAIAVNLINNAMKGDVKAAQYIQNIQLRAQMKKIRAPFTQGGGLRRGCGRMEGHLGKMLQRKAVQIWPTTN